MAQKPPTWRDWAAAIITEVLKSTAGQTEKGIKKALKDAYPFGERSNHPYKIWCDELKRQRSGKLERRVRRTEKDTETLNLF